MENPEIMAGIPALILGSIGLLVALLLTITPEEGAARKLSAGRLAFMVFVALAWLTGIEYVIAIETSYNIIVLMIIAAMKTALIAFFFMRFMRISAAHREEH
jgi:hypothetical protein